MLRDLPEVEIQQKIANWKAEIRGFPSVEESASEDITIKSYGDFEIPQNSLNWLKIYKNHQNSLKVLNNSQVIKLPYTVAQGPVPQLHDVELSSTIVEMWLHDFIEPSFRGTVECQGMINNF